MSDRVDKINEALLAIKQARTAQAIAAQKFSAWMDGEMDTRSTVHAEEMRAGAYEEAMRLVRLLLDLEPWISPLSEIVERELLEARSRAVAEARLPLRDPLTPEMRIGLKQLIDEAVRALQPDERWRPSKHLSYPEGFALPIPQVGDWLPFGRGGKLTDAVCREQDDKHSRQINMGWWMQEDMPVRSRYYEGEKRGAPSKIRSRVGYKDPEPLS